MKTMIPAVAGTYLLVPRLDFGSDDFLVRTTRVPVLGWSNYSADQADPPGTRTSATPIVPFWPEGVSQAGGYLLPDDQGGFSIAVPFAKRVFTGANAMAQYEDFADNLLRGMEEERNQEDSISGEMAAREPHDLQVEDRDEGFTVSVELPHGVFTVTPAEDTREVGSTNSGNSRRTKVEIAADENFLEIVTSLGKTIRAVNSRWKTTPSRTAVLRDIAGIKDAAEYQAAPFPADEDEDLIG